MGTYSSIPVRIELSEFDPGYDGGWVEIKPRRTFGDRLEIRQAGVRVTDGVVQMNIGASALRELQLAVVAWSFDEPVSDEAIRDLDSDLGEWLLDRVREEYASHVRTPAAKSGAQAGPARRRRAR